MKLARIAIIIAVVFGAAYAAFGFWSPRVWNSPDETAVAYFSYRLATTGNLWALEPYNFVANNLVHPRSVLSVDGYLVPGSFYGNMAYFGALFKVVGFAAFSLGTPLMTVLAAICVFFLMRRATDAKRGLIAEFLFLVQPGIWYFASRGLFPNVLFLDLAIIGLAVLFLRPWKKIIKGKGNPLLGVLIDDLAGFVLLGSAFVVRPVEFIWLAPILLALAVARRRSFTWLRLGLGVLVAGAFISIFLMTNNSLFGSPFSLGYTAGSSAPGVAIPALEATSQLPAVISAPRPFILPFGFHPRAALTHLWEYVCLFAWWLPLLALVGFLFTKDRILRRWSTRLFLWTAFVLGIYYGSGVFNDSTVSQWTVGSSYLRYFLPITILLVPLAAEGVWHISKLFSKRGPIVVAGVLAVFVLLSAWTVFFRSSESLVLMHKNLVRYDQIKREVLAMTTTADVIITERSDKIFFPDRRVMTGFREQATLDVLPKLAQSAGLYYYGVMLSDEEYRLINGELAERGLQMGRFKQFGNEMLYGITPND